MQSDRLIRRALWASVPLNLGGALLFAFPTSLGRLAGLPGPVPHVYTASLALFVTLFGSAYAWLARQPRISRPFVAFAVLGKSGFFAVVAACWLLGEVPARAMLAGSADLGFAAVFTWWLIRDRARPDAASVAHHPSTPRRRRA